MSNSNIDENTWDKLFTLENYKVGYGYISDGKASRYFVIINGKALDIEHAEPIVKIIERLRNER